MFLPLLEIMTEDSRELTLLKRSLAVTFSLRDAVVFLVTANLHNFPSSRFNVR